MTVIYKEEIIEGDHDTSKVLIHSFLALPVTLTSWNIQTVNIVEYSNCEPHANNICDTLLKCFVKYRKHPSMPAITEVCNRHPRL